MNETNLRKAETCTKVMGILSEKNLEVKTDEKGIKSIEGYITLRTDPVNLVRFNVKASEKTKDGKPNSVFSGLMTVYEEYKAIADVGEENATVVKVTNGEVNPYTNRQGKDVINFKSNFFNRVENANAENFHAEFEVEVFIRSIVPELDKEGIETGRVVVNCWVPTYNSIEPIMLVAGREDGIADDIMNAFSAGQTVKFYGNIINNRIEHKKTIPVAIGKPRIDITYEYKNDMIITGATAAYGTMDGTPEPYNRETIEAAVRERENRRSNPDNNNAAVAQKPSGNAYGRSLNLGF